jgi:hypothetical protein
LLKKALGDPSAALDGSIPGAISGILSGVVVALLAGILRAEAVGEIVGKVLLGFVIGCGLGTLLGAILAAASRRVRPYLQSKEEIIRLVGGALTGCMVVVIVGGYPWAPLRAGVGAVGVKLWALLCDRVEAAAAPPARMDLEEECPGGDDERTDRRPCRQATSRSSGE